MRIKSRLAFSFALLCTLFGPIFFPGLHLLYFAPYLVICFYQYSRIEVLWRAFGCGILLDLLSSAPFFGFSSLKFCLVTLALFGQTRNFFEDKLSTLPLMTFLFSFLTTAISVLLTLFFGNGFPLSIKWVATDLIIMSAADALYALLVFSLPFELTYKLRKIRSK